MHPETQSNRGSGGRKQSQTRDHYDQITCNTQGRNTWIDQQGAADANVTWMCQCFVTVVKTKPMCYELIFLQRFVWLTWHVQLKSGPTVRVVSSMRFCSSARSSSQSTQGVFDKVLLMRFETAVMLAWRRSRLDRSWEMDESRLFSWSLVSVVAARRHKETKTIYHDFFITLRQDHGNK